MIEAAYPPPAFLGAQTKLVNHGQHRVSCHTVLGLIGAVANRAECGLDRIRGAQMDPVLGREIVKGQQAVAVLLQALSRLRILGLIGGDKAIERPPGVFPGLGHPDLVQGGLRFGLHRLRQGIENILGLVHPAALMSGPRINLIERRPEPQCAIAHCQLGRDLQAPALEPQQHLTPALGPPQSSMSTKAGQLHVN